MPRRRLKHKQVIEAIERDDVQVVWERIKNYWSENIRPYEGTIWSVILVVIVVLVGTLWYKNHKNARIADANLYLSEARTLFDSGDVDGALSQLNYVLPQGEYAVPGIDTAAQIAQARISYASGDYDAAISLLKEISRKVPASIKIDVLYQLVVAQESKGDFEAALGTLEEIRKQLGPEPDLTNPERASSPWDRFFYQRGRILAHSGKTDEAVKDLVSVSPKSPWFFDASSEIGWIKTQEIPPLNVSFKS